MLASNSRLYYYKQIDMEPQESVAPSAWGLGYHAPRGLIYLIGLKFETVKYGHESCRTRAKNDCAGEAQQQLQTTHPSSPQRRCPQIKPLIFL
jgi:hypothetical protein